MLGSFSDRVREEEAAIEALELRRVQLEKSIELLEVRAAVSANAAIAATGMTLPNLGGTALLTEEQIVGSARPARLYPGVYFLIRGSRVVYVGQSFDVHRRILSHGPKNFDRVFTIQVAPEFLTAVEAIYIARLDPELNRNHPSIVASSRLDGRLAAEANAKTAEGKDP